jgi:hypothetical protein
MAARIIALLQSPRQTRAMGESGRRIVSQRFSCEAQLERTRDLYERLLWRAGVLHTKGQGDKETRRQGDKERDRKLAESGTQA